MRYLTVPLVLVATTATSFALPHPNNPYRDGANHHVGDDSFVAEFGRAPRDVVDSEKLRMRVHLEHVRAWLGSRPATRPELAAKRAELLGYLDDYIAKGITPTNSMLPWRTPVFIDDRGAICAVGYLIERSVGRALPEQIADEHRYELLEAIDAAMPAVHAWIEASGMTLDELASIQPAYSEADVDTWQMWDLVKHAPKDGPFDKRGVAGTFKRKRMEGVWTVTDLESHNVVGKGTLKRGTGKWQSFYRDGKTKLAEGLYVSNRAHGAWKFFHPSGNVAAEGKFASGDRAGAWRFYHDTPNRTLIAKGKFAGGGHVVGTWQHFDANGTLLAKSRTETPSQWVGDPLDIDGGQGFILDIAPGADGVRHQIHQGNIQLEHRNIESYNQRLDLFSKGGERIYVHVPFSHQYHGEPPPAELIYDAAGFRLVKDGARWTASNCRWASKRKEIAKAGDIARLHGVLYNAARRRAVIIEDHGSYKYAKLEGDPAPVCGKPRPVAAERGARIDAMLASREIVRAHSPDFVKKLVRGDDPMAPVDPNPDPVDPDDVDPDDVDPDDVDPDDDTVSKEPDRVQDMTRVLTSHMVLYLQWPHVDRRFVQVFGTMAGRLTRHWAGGEPEPDE